MKEPKLHADPTGTTLRPLRLLQSKAPRQTLRLPQTPPSPEHIPEPPPPVPDTIPNLHPRPSPSVRNGTEHNPTTHRRSMSIPTARPTPSARNDKVTIPPLR